MTVEAFISEHYGLRVSTVSALTEGVLNTNYRVTTDGGDFIFKIFNFKKRAELNFELDALGLLVASGFPAPAVRSDRSDEPAPDFDGKPVILYSYINGNTMPRFDARLLTEVGAHLARLHVLLKNFPNRTRDGLWDPPKLRLLIDGRWRDVPNGDFVRDEIKKYSFDASLPHGFTHQDVKPENIIVKNGRIAGIVDFDNSYWGTLPHDLTTTMIWTCFSDERLDRAFVRAFLTGYESVRPLLTNEKKSLDDSLRWRVLREAFITPYVTAHRRELSKERSDYFIRLYHGLGTASVFESERT